MSGSADSGENSRIYGFSSRPGRDRHIQNIIDHTNTFFRDRSFGLPTFNSAGSVSGNARLTGRFDYEQEDEGDYDEFDRNLLGRPHISSHVPPSEYRDQRLSLPFASTPIQPRRVVGDASHHFRPFRPRDPDLLSPFSGGPMLMEAFEPSPASLPIFLRDGSRRMKELQPGAQTVTPPFYAASTLVPNLDRSLSSSSPTHLGGSSPSARLSLIQKAKKADSPLVAHKGATKLKLNLDHAPEEPPVVNGTRLVEPRQAMPDKLRTVFPYEVFNVVQSKCFPLAYGSNDNLVVSAPTGSGKTAILEMAICRLVATSGSENFKIVYQAPTKSLCSERARDWEKKFSHMNLRCVELTGDTSQAQARRVGNASIIVTTPEKWDSITRKWSDHRKLLEMIRLVLIDEVHILKDSRGATLEAVVSRMKTIGASIRFVALSATVPNIGDIAKWLGRNHANQQNAAVAETFGEELRPVKLQRYVYGYDNCNNDFVFESSLDKKLVLLLAKHSEKKPIMIFCFTRKSCESTARKLAEWWATSIAEDKAWPAPTRRVPVISKDLQEIVRYGVAFHHAGLDAQDRSAVSQNFHDGQLHVICCTSTLAVGVNLPCHTVVLKGTVGFSEDKLQEYSDLEVMQMLGRAGRPQFDDSAVAIIMTKKANVDRYKRMMSGEEKLESTLHQNLVEHLNSEISLGTIQDAPTAKRWIGGTFLSVRVRQSPQLYHVDARNAEDADKKMEEWCERDLKLLQQYKLVTEKAPFKCTEYGHAMSRYMVTFETMKMLLDIPRGAGLEEILTTLCGAIEFKDFRFKPDERVLFRELNKSPFILHPIRETLTQTWHKVFLIVQVHLGGVELPSEKGSFHFKQRIAADKFAVFDRLNRLVRCLVDCRAYDGDGLSTKAGLELARALAANSWENRPSQLSQIPGFGSVTVRKWVSHGVHTVLSLADRSFEEIERISSRNPPYGMNLLKTLDKFPRLALRAQLTTTANARQSQPDDSVAVTLNVNLRHCNKKDPPIWNDKVPAVTFIVLTTDGNLAYFWRGNLRKVDKSAGLNLKFPVALSGPDEKISCWFSCEEIVGTQVTETLEPDVPKAAFRNKKVQSAVHLPPAMDSLDDSMEYGDVPDEDMLTAALDLTNPNGETEPEPLDYPGPLDDIEEDLPIVDTLLPQTPDPSAPGPVKMDNGRWMCNHRCRNGGLTGAGKPCSHKCCHEGLDKPRPPPRGKKNKEDRINEGVQEGDALVAETSTKQSKAFQSAIDNRTQDTKSSKRLEKYFSTAPSHPKDRPQMGSLKTTLPNGKRKRTTDNGIERTRFAKRSKSANHDSDSDLDTLSEIECIDLVTTSVGNEARNSWSKKPHSPKASRGTERSLSSVDADAEYDDDIFDDELPDVKDLLQLNGWDDVGTSQITSEQDRTLYPGVVHTLKESMDYG
ncbi:P-loop containing nucleoside triphosphate hydrolase protein [Hypoxylon sp. NC1633]|nr:P-loop containing nucleoside triphosphate hydrolase protein [Hypoxylon sp. NC1633]